MRFLSFFWDQKVIDGNQPKAWATPLQKYQKSIDRVFDPKNEDF